MNHAVPRWRAALRFVAAVIGETLVFLGLIGVVLLWTLIAWAGWGE